MRTNLQAVHQRAVARSARFGQRLARDENGVTAIEFAMVGVPFFMMLFGIMGVGLCFFSVFNLENAVEQAARPFRTGESKTLYPSPTPSDPLTAASKLKFSEAVCDQLAPFFDCMGNSGKLRIQVVNVTELQKTTPGALPSVGQCLGKSSPSATSNDILVPYTDTKFDPTKQSDTMVVTACYEMDLFKAIPFIKLGNMPNGSTMLQASTAFKNEPY
jgi:Flp pilus assembly protein TadG